MKNYYIGILAIVAFFGASERVSAATLQLIPDKDAVAVNGTVSVSVIISSPDASINAAQATIQFPSSVLEVTRISKENSVFSFWLEEPAIGGNKDSISFTGGASVGLSGQSLRVLTITFKTKAAGPADVTLTNAAVTASDGGGTNVLSSVRGAHIESVTTTQSLPSRTPEQITRAPIAASGHPSEPFITVPLYPNPSAWNNFSSKFTAEWALPPDVTEVASVLNTDPAFIPTASGGLYDKKTFDAPTDGVWFVHVRFKNSVGWGPAAHYHIAIDTAPPAPFDIHFNETFPTHIPSPTLHYATQDRLSGIETYIIRVDDGGIQKTLKTDITLDPQSPGKHTVRIKAQDNAGNITEKSADIEILPIDAPSFTFVTDAVDEAIAPIVVHGLANPKFNVIVTLRRSDDRFVASNKTAVDASGEWATLFQNLSEGTYSIDAKTVDAVGAQSFLIVYPKKILVREQPLFTIAGFEIGDTSVYLAIIFLLVLGLLLHTGTHFPISIPGMRLFRKILKAVRLFKL